MTMLKRHLPFPAWIISVKQMPRWQPGGLDFSAWTTTNLRCVWSCSQVFHPEKKSSTPSFCWFSCLEWHQLSCGMDRSQHLTWICSQNALATNQQKRKSLGNQRWNGRSSPVESLRNLVTPFKRTRNSHKKINIQMSCTKSMRAVDYRSFVKHSLA